MKNWYTTTILVVTMRKSHQRKPEKLKIITDFRRLLSLFFPANNNFSLAE